MKCQYHLYSSEYIYSQELYKQPELSLSESMTHNEVTQSFYILGHGLRDGTHNCQTGEEITTF